MNIKETIRAEIERLKERAAAERVLHPQTILAAKNYLLIKDYDNLLSFLDTLPEQPALPGIDEEGVPGMDFIPVEWVDACERYGKWKIVSAEQPVDGIEEAARHSEILTYPMPEDGDIEKVMKVQEARIFHEIGFIAGAEWMKSKYEK